MIDKVFGEIEYEYGWNGKIQLNCFGKKQSVDLIISGEIDHEFDSWQYDSFHFFIHNWDNMQNEMKKSIYEYYCQLRIELGYDDGSNADFPNIHHVDDIVRLIQIDALVIPVSGIYEERCVNLALSCIWDEENGLGIRFINEMIDDIGYQDIAF